MTRKKLLIVGNWKMYPKTVEEARNFFQKFRGHARVEVVVSPPFPYLGLFTKPYGYALGAQDMFWEREGSFTGSVSGTMLKSMGVRYVIIGHSERRRLGETDEIIHKKLKQVVSLGLRPILCVGEERRDSDGAFFSFIKRQVEDDTRTISRKDIARLIIAYEPLWAIGSGKPANAADTGEAALFIKKTLAHRFGILHAKKVKILYGGSVDAKNAAAFLGMHDIAGLLVGKESRNPKSFSDIIACAASLS